LPAQLSLRALGRRAVNQQGAGGSHCETTECRALSPPALEVVGCLGARQCSGQGLCCGNARLCCNGMAPPFHLTCKQPVKFLSQGASERVGKGKVCRCARVGQQDKEIRGDHLRNALLQMLVGLLAGPGYPGSQQRKGTARSVSWGLPESPPQGKKEHLLAALSTELCSDGDFPLAALRASSLRLLLLCMRAACREIPARGVKC